MIKKNTKIIFEGSNLKVEDIGGIPLAEGEMLTIKTDKGIEKFRVKQKLVECEQQGSDMIANITYKLIKHQ